MRFSILYDNRSVREGMKTGWGFSCLAETEETSIMFDTGANGEKLLANMQRLKKAASQVRILVLSHNHPDHTVGAVELLRLNRNIRVFVPSSFSSSFKERLCPSGDCLVEVKGASQIAPGVFTTGETGRFFKEQALVFESENGSVLLTGCAHSGIVTLVKKARERVSGKPMLLIGGFHLFDKLSFQIKRTVSQLKDLGVTRIAPCHCTTERGISLISSAYGKNFIPAGAGTIVEV